MIISALNSVVHARNITRKKHGLKPIDSPYKLWKSMKKYHLVVSRPILVKLWGDEETHFNKSKKHLNKKYLRYNSANSITFDTLDKLMKYFNKPAGDFFHFISKPIYIYIQSFSTFMKYNKLATQLKNFNNLRNKGHYSFVKIIDKSHIGNNCNAYLLLIENTNISSGIYTSIGINIKCVDIFPLIHGKIRHISNNNTKNMIRTDINYCIEHFTNKERLYLDSILIRNSYQEYAFFRGSQQFVYPVIDGVRDLDNIPRKILSLSKDNIEHPHNPTADSLSTDRDFSFVFVDIDK